jgi:hypothetical protein
LSRPALDGASALARATLPDTAVADFDRLVAALTAGPAAPLGAVLRRQLPGTTGARWLHQERLSPTTRTGTLTAEQWLSLFRCWTSSSRAPGASGGPAPRNAGRPSKGHGPGAQAAPRWF